MSSAQAACSNGTVTLAPNALRRKLLGVALNAPEFRRELDKAALDIRNSARPTVTEATIESRFEMVVYALLREIGLKFNPDKETAVDRRRHVARGRTDSRLGALVIEYKRPSLLRSAAEQTSALSQLEEYIESLSLTSDAPYVGLLTNGLVVIETRALAGKIIQRSSVEPLSGSVLLRLTQAVISLALTALTSRNLIRDFCGTESDGVLFQTARLLESILATTPQPKTTMLRSEWEELFRLAHDDQSQQQRIQDRRSALAALFGINIPNAAIEYRALFALHTAYAILLKFIAYRVVSDVYFGRVPQDFRALAKATPSALRSFCGKLEDGDVFRQLGILNLLEGDFFSWYSDKGQWTQPLADSIKEVLLILARYEEAQNIFRSDEVPDLFRELYQATVPRAVRSSFGEFYTPYWLAEHVLDAASSDPNSRIIDPCCGSGTFVIAAIARIRRDSTSAAPAAMLKRILSKVVAIDLNPLSVLTTRIHYFIHLSDLLPQDTTQLTIPVYLGDAASIPERVEVDCIPCLRYQLKTLKTPINAVLPVSVVQDTPVFVRLMQSYESAIKEQDRESAVALLTESVPLNERKSGISTAIESLTDNLLTLEAKGWNGIWARVLSNFLTTACLGKFTAVVGNPPWIDWKNLPSGYRDRVKTMCIDRGLFSGAGRTGGINLNICALIAYVSMNNWLDDGGRLALLMPRELINQASYEGWRRLGRRWGFVAFHDWSEAGHPFDPVKEDFMTFVLGRTQPKTGAVPVLRFQREPGGGKAQQWRNSEEAMKHLKCTRAVAGQIIPGSTAFTIAGTDAELEDFSAIAGNCEYIGREGVQFYPQELQVFHYVSPGPRPGTAWLNNVQVEKAKYKLPRGRVLLETKYLHPLVTAPTIKAFAREEDGLLVEFPYEASNPTKPIEAAILKKTAPLLLDYYKENRDTIEKLSPFNAKIRGKNSGDFYGLARTGPYSFANTHVAFRKDTKWCAVVVSPQTTPWGEERISLFQSHAASICEKKMGGMVSEDEAHYICAIFNTPIVERFIVASSDERSYKIRPPIFVPLFDSRDSDHLALVNGSKIAHAHPEQVEILRAKMEVHYMRICRRGSRLREMIDARIASERLAEIEDDPNRLVDGNELKTRLEGILS